MIDFKKTDIEWKRLQPTVKRLSKACLLGKRIILKGKENFVQKGPNIIVGNHIGSFKDIAVLLEIVPRRIFFTANKQIFSKDELNYLFRRHLGIHLKQFGSTVNMLISPIRIPLVNFVTKNLAAIGTIPVDLSQKKKLAIDLCQKYLENGKAVILLQGRGRIIKTHPNPYVHPFRRGASILCYNLLTQKNIDVPVTPLVMFGTHLPYVSPVKIKINVGKPLYISDYLDDGFDKTVEKFRKAMEDRVISLLFEILKP